MLATVPNEVPFPHIGSQALFRGLPCTIVQRNNDGTFIVSGPTFRRRAVSEELVDASRITLTPFGAWFEARVEALPAGSDHPGTATADLYEDYLAWLKAAEIDDGRPLRQIAFARSLMDAGLKTTIVSARAPYQAKPMHQRGFRAMLKRIDR